jgi:hypothetical protein
MFIADDSFCDEDENNNPDFPQMHWKNEFIKTDTGTKVQIKITFANEAELEKFLEMSFEAALHQLTITLMNYY